MNTPPTPLPSFESTRLLIRPWRASDADDMFEYSSDREVTRLAMWPPHDSLDETHRTIADAIVRYEAESWMYLGIELKSESKLIGSVGFAQWNKSDRRAEFSFAVNRNYWGQRIVIEAAPKVLAFGWEEMGLHRVEARTIVQNTASIAILSKLGFQREGLAKEAALVDGTFCDVINWGLLRFDRS